MRHADETDRVFHHAYSFRDGFLHRHSPTSQKYLIETMGGGAK